METQETQELAEQVKDFLRGMKRVRADDMPRLAEFDNWRELARREIERRATRVIEMFDDSILAAIAKGDLDLPAAIREVMKERS
jgi:molecular chaperone GrpE (heat shock protein)